MSQNQHKDPSINQNPAYSSDEIDLRDLIFALWESRFLIISVMVVTLAIAVAYTFFVTPVYQTQATLLPPPSSGLAAYNKAFQMSGPAADNLVANRAGDVNERLNDDAIVRLGTDDVFQYFVRHITSVGLKRSFFEQHYLPQQSSSAPADGGSVEHLWQSFLTQLSIDSSGNDLVKVNVDNANKNSVKVTVDNAGSGLVRVTWTGPDPTKIADWTNLYTQMAIEAAQHEIANNLASSLDALRNGLGDQIASLRTGAQKQREQKILRLTEALSLAESIGLDRPLELADLLTSYSGETAYMRGANVLRNEIELLKQRTSDDPFIPELAQMFMRQSLLDTVNVSPHEIIVARIDEPAAIPLAPIKPRKTLIMALGLVLGGMLGVFLVLIRNMFHAESGTRSRQRYDSFPDQPTDPMIPRTDQKPRTA